MTFCLFLFMIPTVLSSGIPPQKHEVQELLNRLNKPAVKSIQSPDGDTIDCVHIKHQPAFDHPLLKNHTIQADIKCSSTGKPIAQPWHLNGECPEGTIPIKRAKEADILRARSLENYGKKRQLSVRRLSSKSGGEASHEYAFGSVDGTYYGTRAKFNLWRPQVAKDDFSLAQLWILGGQDESIEVGWQVFPEQNGDNEPRLFIYWTSDGYQSTGCYNLACSGFVQLSKEIALGGALSPVSTLGGAQHDVDISVLKKPGNGNWELTVNGHVLGYWPASLYKRLADSATTIQWGGEIVNTEINGQHSTTQMGSGHFPEEGAGKASYVSNIQVASSPNALEPATDIQLVAETANCYGVQKDGSNGFFYGGPGRNPKCP
jgi:hypothetical protein